MLDSQGKQRTRLAPLPLCVFRRQKLRHCRPHGLPSDAEGLWGGRDGFWGCVFHTERGEGVPRKENEKKDKFQKEKGMCKMVKRDKEENGKEKGCERKREKGLKRKEMAPPSGPGGAGLLKVTERQDLQSIYSSI